MKNRLPNRLVALFSALVFLLSGAGDAYGLHACSLHSPEALAGGHSEQAAHSGHGSHAPAAADAPHDQHHSNGADPGHGPCTCKGACPTSAIDTPRFPAAVSFAVNVVEAPQVAPLGDVEPLPRLTPYLFPYSQAPPAIG